MDKTVAEALAGTLGHFWVDLKTFNRADTSWQGHAERQGRNFAIRTIKRPDEGAPLHGVMTLPEAVYSITDLGGIVAYDIRNMPENSILAGNKISTRSYHARGLAVGVNAGNLASSKVIAITAHFHGLAIWSGMSGGATCYDKYPDGRLKGITYSTRNVAPESAKISGGRTIEIGVTWSAKERQFDQFSAATPLTFSVTRSRPGSWHDIIRPIIAFQNLLGLAHNAFVPCIDGSITPHYRRDTDPDKGDLWSGELMDVPEGMGRLSETATVRPVFSLSAIGGIDGIRRWILLTERYPRAVGPLTTAYRFGTSTVEVELMNIAVAIEYWVKVCRTSKDRPRWATIKKKGFVELLSGNVGAEFANFVGGDESRWSTLFWDRYTALKHDPLVAYDSREIDTLMRGGRVLLMCALLNRVARSKEPTRWICESTEYYALRERTKELMAKNPKLFRR